MQKIKIWTEIMTRDRVTTEYLDIPESWPTMTKAQRQDYMDDAAMTQENNLVSSGSALVTVDEDGKEVDSDV